MANKNRPKLPQMRQQVPVNTIRATVHKGPLPDPLTLEQYNKVLPKAAERIMAAFEEQTRHRHEIEKRQMDDVQERTAIERAYADSETRLAERGLICAFVLSVMFLIGGIYLIANSHEILGTIFGGTGAAPLISTFIKDTRHNHHDEK